MSSTPPNFFLSHATKNDAYIAELEQFLKKAYQGTVTFNDVHSIDPDQEFLPKIKEGIDACTTFVVAITADSMNSKWVREEVEYARSIDKPILPIRLDDSPLNDLFKSRDVLDFRPGRKLRIPYNTKGLPATYTGKLYGRDAELDQLLTDLGEKNTHIVAYDAMGGTGKTALLYHFVQHLREKDWPGLDSVFIWSFYSQGSSEDKQTHAADFFEAAYDHFHPDGRAGMPDVQRDQGLELAELIADQRTLLVLDGLEPLQYAAGGNNQQVHQYGGIKDQGVKALLSRLADIGDGGLTVVTTRIKIHELTHHSAFQSRPLDQLPTEAAIELLRDRGIEAKTFPPETGDLPENVRADFVQAIESLQHHALSLNLAAHLVAQDYDGQIKAFADVLPHLHDDSGIDENHRSPFRVMRALEVGLYRVLHHRLQRMSAQESIADSPAANQLALLYFLGLFDRPAALDLLPVVYDASEELQEAVHMLPEDKAEYLRQVEEEAKKRDQILNDPKKSDEERTAARHHFETQFYKQSFHYWLPPVFARFDQGPRRVSNALQQLNQQGLVSKVRLTTGEGGHAEWESMAGDKEWDKHHVDCHPLIREYFGHQLEHEYPDAFRAAHGRLYDRFRFAGLPEAFRDPVAYGALALKAAFPEHVDRLIQNILDNELRDAERPVIPPSLLTGSVESVQSAQSAISIPEAKTGLQTFLPPDESGMTPLFAAIGHGCLAGRHAECWSEVYWPRISRGNERYAVTKLGLYGQELAALASFFLTRPPDTDEPLLPFSTPHPDFQPSDQALVLSLAGFALRAIGRLPDAVAPFRAQPKLHAELKDLRNAAGGYGNLSELLLTLGHLVRDQAGEPGALPTAEAAVIYADQSGDLTTKQRLRACADANALLAAGRLGPAEARFREAEALQRERQPQLPRLYSLQGFLYGDLLLARNRPQEVAGRAEYVFNAYQKYNAGSLLDHSLGELNAARSKALLNKEPGTNHQELPPFLASLLEANEEEFVVRGYLARAELLLLASTPDRDALEAALSETETRAKRGPMPLFLAEAFLLRARMELVVSANPSRAQAASESAKQLIDKHGYERRRPDLAVLQCEIDPSLENFQTAFTHVQEGWWHLISRLEALAVQIDGPPKKGLLGFGKKKGAAEALLEPLRRAELKYHRERDAYLAEVEKELEAEKVAKQKKRDAEIAEAFAHFGEEKIANIAQKHDLPADWSEWPDNAKDQILEAFQKSKNQQS